MKQSLTTCILVLLFFFVGVAQENALLWKISGNGLTRDSYLFGTLHMACSADFSIPTKVEDALKKTDCIAYEVDVTKPENRQIVQEKLKPNANFFNGLAPYKKEAIDSALVAHGIPATIFDQISPAMVVSLISMKSFDCPSMQDIKMMELEISKMDAAKGKTVSELEDITFQLDLLDSLFSAEDLYAYFTSGLDMKEITRKMVNAYFSENLMDLQDLLLNTAYLSEEKQRQLLTIRNQNWIAKMPNMMKEKPHFFAVGAGHLIGKSGLIQLLKNAGYTLTPVMN
ncbi:TraB/GumN family protein [Sphingobacterium suaedae]|uniref:TraB/GumN family protein n=1 Tax=Sphingobacterium suaedae TaxID=1686402 RepID=A0ABW5KGU3_9SPHI